jgi:phenylpyruvate tautomerase PptA (4-oxalocrotonate tautomerase family)
MSLAALGMIGAGAHAAFTTSTTSSQTITAGTWGASPTVAITYPVNAITYDADWTNTITGTASSNSGAGTYISAVSVAIEDTATDLWWNGISFNSSSETFVGGSGTTSWNLPLGGASLTSGVTYKVIAKATDNIGYVGTSSTVSFTYETALPTVTITYPANGTNVCACSYTGKITGTASSNSGSGTTITTVSVAIENTTTGKWWSGSSFSASSEYFVKASGTTSWTLALAGSSLTTGDAYSVVAEATDSLGNVGTSSTVSFTYCIKTAPPTVTITYPVNKTTYGTNWTGTITGTASAGTEATITKVSVTIEDTATRRWWNGSSFGSTSQTFVAATGTTTWMLSLASSNLTSGTTYRVIAQATDNLGNVGTSSTVSFTYCVHTAPPTVTITYPVNNATYGTNWTGEITGSASAGTGATIAKTSVAIEDTKTDKWWNGTSFSASSQSFVTATGTTTWLLPLGAGSFTSGDTYRVIAEATDSLGNVGTSSTVTFTYCNRSTVPPTVAITYPVNATTYGANWTGAITGTASSNSGAGTAIKSVSVAIEDTTTKLWWNGLSFNYDTRTFVAASGTTSWSLGLARVNLTSGNSYSVVAQATDSLGNVGTSSTVSFTYCIHTAPPTPPTMSITYPVNKTTYGSNWTGKITGSAASNSGPGTAIASVSVAVENTKTSKWWNGTGFSTSSQTFVVASGTTAWTLALPTGNLTSGVTYSVVAQATDSLGNVGTSSTVSFTYNTTSPTITITYPVNNTTYGANWTGKITGSASSNAGAGTTIKSTAVAVENTSIKRWWNGTSFSSTAQIFVVASGTTGWSLALPKVNLTSGDTYSVIAEATDSLGNVGTSSTVTFSYSSQCTAHALGGSHD